MMTKFKRFEQINEGESPWKSGTSFGIDEVGKFWVVMKPTEHSTLGDILFDTTLSGFVIQAYGGMRQDEVHGIYRDSGKARAAAENLLSQRRTRT